MSIPVYSNVNMNNNTIEQLKLDGLNPTPSVPSEEELYDINEHSLVVSLTEPTTDRRKVWFKKGKNQFNKNNMIPNLNISSDGTFCSDALSSLYYTKVPAGQTFTISSNVSRQWVYNFSNRVPISAAAGSNAVVTRGSSITVTVPAGYTYLVIRAYPSIGEDNITQNIQVEQGSVATSYEAYVEPDVFVKNDNEVYEEFNNKSSMKFLGSGACSEGINVFDEFDIVICDDYRNYDILLLQFRPDFEGGTGFLFTNTNNGSNCVVRIGSRIEGDPWAATMRASIRHDNYNAVKLSVISKGDARPITSLGLQAIYGVKF